MQKYCPQCHQPNPPDAVFCRHCASPLPELPAQPGQEQPQSQPQPAWGNQGNPGNPGNFGNQYGNSPLQQNAQSAPGADSNRPLIAIGLVVAGLFCCGPLTSLPGTILGWLELTAIKEGRAPQSGLMLAQAAFWGGIAVTIITIIIGLVLLLLTAIGGGRG